MCYLRNPSDINLLVRVPTGKTGDRDDRTEFDVLKFYVPFLLSNVGANSELIFEKEDEDSNFSVD